MDEPDLIFHRPRLRPPCMDGLRKETTPIFMLPMMCKARMTVSILRQNQPFHGYSKRACSISGKIHQTRESGYSGLTRSGLRHIDRTLPHDGVELVTYFMRITPPFPAVVRTDAPCFSTPWAKVFLYSTWTQRLATGDTLQER